MSARVLVTGGGGFVGKALVRALTARGEGVRVLDLQQSPNLQTDLQTDRQTDLQTDWQPGRDADPAPAIDWMEGSVTDDHAVREAMKGIGTVYHLAGIADLWHADRSIFERINVAGTRVVLNEARRAGVQRFVQCSSLTTLVARSAPIGPSAADETCILAPDQLIGAYPQSKRAADRLVEQAAGEGFNASIAMPTEPLGAGDTNLTPPTRMILDFANGRTPAYIDCTLNFVPVDSLAGGLVAVAERGAPGERYLLGGDNLDMRALLAMIEAETGRPMPTVKLPYGVALLAGIIDTHLAARLTGKAPKAPLTGVRLAGRRVSFSSEKAARDLGWRAAPVLPAFRAMLQWARERGLMEPRDQSRAP